MHIEKQYVKDLANEENSAEFPISLLYPTANAFYRKLGYEVAGSLYETTLDMAEVYTWYDILVFNRYIKYKHTFSATCTISKTRVDAWIRICISYPFIM